MPVPKLQPDASQVYTIIILFPVIDDILVTNASSASAGVEWPVGKDWLPP